MPVNNQPRTFNGIPGNAFSFPHYFNPTGTASNGENNSITGVWMPLSAADLGIAPVTPNFSIVTSGQLTIPAGANSWSINTVSGSTFVNGTGAFIAGVTLSSLSLLAAPLVVGNTGGKVFVQWGT